MKLVSVNVSLPRDLAKGDKTVRTGIFKEPVAGRVLLRTLNLDGDGQADLKAHGGVHKAVYVYSLDHYDHWRRELGLDDSFPDGQFGENFTVERLTDETVHVGDVFRVGGALVEVTQPRVPCFKLGLKMGLEGFEKKFLTSRRLGYYLRVLEEGEVGAGDLFELARADPVGMTVREMIEIGYFDTRNVEAIRRAVSIDALSPGWKEWLERRLARL